MGEALKIHAIPGYICNLFLVEYSDRMLLLDCGCINDVKRIEKYCEEVMGRPVTDIKLAVVSHNHPDHAGGALIWRDKYHIPIAAHPRIDFWYDGPGGFLQHKVDCYLATWVAYRRKIGLEKILFSRKIRPDYVLEDGASLPFFPDWRVLHVPGHTFNDIALYNKEEKALYPGDCLVMNVEGKLLLPVPVLFPERMAASFDRLGKLDANKIYLAHGKTIENQAAAKETFTYLKSLLNQPKTPLSSTAHKVSYFSPEYRRNHSGGS